MVIRKEIDMIILLNIFYALFGFIMCIGGMYLAYKVFDKLTPFNTATQLEKGNQAVGLFYMGIFIAIGLASLSVGLALN